MQLLVRNRVKDYAVWRQVFDADTEAAADYGLSVARVWRAHDDANNVFFLLNVESVERANAFMARPESQANGERSGVIDGEFFFLQAV